MRRKQKVTFTFYVDESDDDRSISRKVIARRIRSIALRKGELMSAWANELGVTRAFVSQVVAGRRGTQYVRNFIETRLNETFWKQPNQ